MPATKMGHYFLAWLTETKAAQPHNLLQLRLESNLQIYNPLHSEKAADWKSRELYYTCRFGIALDAFHSENPLKTQGKVSSGQLSLISRAIAKLC
jgi:hypothetical protein